MLTRSRPRCQRQPSKEPKQAQQETRNQLVEALVGATRRARRALSRAARCPAPAPDPRTGQGSVTTSSWVAPETRIRFGPSTAIEPTEGSNGLTLPSTEVPLLLDDSSSALLSVAGL